MVVSVRAHWAYGTAWSVICWLLLVQVGLSLAVMPFVFFALVWMSAVLLAQDYRHRALAVAVGAHQVQHLRLGPPRDVRRRHAFCLGLDRQDRGARLLAPEPRR